MFQNIPAVSSQKDTMSSTILRVLQAGANVKLKASDYSDDELREFVHTARAFRAQLILDQLEGIDADDLYAMAQEGGQHLQLEFGQRHPWMHY